MKLSNDACKELLDRSGCSIVRQWRVDLLKEGTEQQPGTSGHGRVLCYPEKQRKASGLHRDIFVQRASVQDGL